MVTENYSATAATSLENTPQEEPKQKRGRMVRIVLGEFVPVAQSMNKFFREERRRGQRLNVERVRDRPVAATGLGGKPCVTVLLEKTGA